MKRKILFLIIFTFIISSGFLFRDFFGVKKIVANDLEFDEQTATVRAIKKNLPSVVSVVVYENEENQTLDSPAGVPETKQRKIQKSRGSGFIISSDGYIVTNKHVVDAVAEFVGKFTIVLNSGEEYEAELAGRDPFNDLAVLKIEASDLPIVELGDSSKLEVGMTVIAIGNSLGRYQNSVTKGIISGLRRDLSSVDNGLNEVIQTDAEINLGNSGGPLIDLHGEVIGINVAKDNIGSSIGFTIPINDAKQVIESIKKHKRIIRPILGVRYQQLTEQDAGLNQLPRKNGAWIRAVIENSPARKAGILPDDIIFEINAVEINEKNTLANMIRKYRPGNKIGLKIQRGDKVIIRIVELGEYK
ncbi:trypsin-like peptidase domain-containing protein [Candidatus Parcubacteria bacterium]|nr:trypsin-like peptidase domain-containing protein [Candidatus Parcubacteria bacterium]